MNQTLDRDFAVALRRELTATVAAAPGRRTRRRIAGIASGVVAALALGGGVTAVAGLQPVDQIADPPLAPPVILNGVGPATVPLPAAPGSARYVHIELTCFDGLRCDSPAGGVDGPADSGIHKVERGALPLSEFDDPHNAQDLDPIYPAQGVPVDVDSGTHWRLYAVYTDRIDPTLAPVAGGRTAGVPGLDVPDLVPATATDGRAGWVEYAQLTYLAQPDLTSDGAAQDPLPVYAADGTTVIGEADVSRSSR